MTLTQVAKQGLVHYRRTHLAVGLAVLVATAVLTGALAVGDSMRYTLRTAQEARLGRPSRCWWGAIVSFVRHWLRIWLNR